MLPLWRTKATALVFAWTLFQVTLVNAQGFYFKDLGLTCNSDQTFQYLGCALNDNIWNWAPEDPPTPGNAIGTKSYINFAQNGHVNHTVTPHFCTDTCRAHGFKYAAVRDGYYCRCGGSIERGSQLIDPSVAENSCNTPCSGDGGDTCGDGTHARVYVDPSFPDEAGLENAAAQVAGYQKLGCFQRVGFSVDESAVENHVVATTGECFTQCADYGYPYAVITRDNGGA